MSLQWYVVHAYSGFEKKVAQTIKEKAVQKGMAERISDVLVPTEGVVEIKKGKKVNTERKFFPGYVLVKMDMNDDTWHLIKSVPKVTGFLGAQNKPKPISETEVQHIMQQVTEGGSTKKQGTLYEVGEQVKIIDGPFESFVGVIEDVDKEKGTLKVAVSIFGRATPVELEFMQVEKTNE